MPPPAHDGDWIFIGGLVAKELENSAGRIKAEIYRQIGEAHNANPTIVQRCYAAFVACRALAESDRAFANAIERLPLSIAEIILRWSTYDAKKAHAVTHEYEAGKLGLREIREQEQTARRRNPDARRRLIDQAEALVVTRVKALYQNRARFDLFPIEPGRRSGGAARFPELIGTTVDFVGEWSGPPSGRIAVTVLSLRPGDPGFVFRHRVQNTVWSALGMVHLGWSTIIAIVGEFDAEPFRIWLAEHRVATDVLDIWTLPLELQNKEREASHGGWPEK